MNVENKMPLDEAISSPSLQPTVSETFNAWARIGMLSFGGPAAQIALMHREIVEDKKWITEKQYLNALSFCMLLPGPEAMQLATYVGWRIHGVWGGLLAGLLFVLPGAFIVLALAAIYSLFGDVNLLDALFVGIKATVIAIVIQALFRISQKALVRPLYWCVALCAFIGIFFLNIPYPYIVIAAALVGFCSVDKNGPDDVGSVAQHKHSIFKTLSTAIVWLLIWWVPLLLIASVFPDSVLADIGMFFSKLAVVTFGGAYAVLSYMAQDVVSNYGWLTATEMIDGLGLAETTPGPLILVTEFVGFIAAYNGSFWMGLAGAAIALWATFAPCFLWIFVGAPYIDWIASQPRLKSALSAITAAVVGVILNLSIWFALHVMFQDVQRKEYGWFVVWFPEVHSIDWVAVILMVFSAVLLFKFRWSVVQTLLITSLLSAAFVTLT